MTVFGSARTQPDDPVYTAAVETGRLLAKAGFGIITGGGPGILERHDPYREKSIR